MIRFRRHDIVLARAEEEEDRRAATALHPPYSDGWHAEVVLLELDRAARLGLWHCYPDAEAMCYDMWPQFAWRPDAQRVQVRLVLADPRWPAIAEYFLQAHGFDLEAELREALA